MISFVLKNSEEQQCDETSQKMRPDSIITRQMYWTSQKF